MRDHLLPTDKTGDNVHPSLVREPGRHCDGGGLYLEVAAPGQASWMFRHKNGWRSLGSANGYSIREARAKAAVLWQAARRGEDPFALLATLRAPKVPATQEKPKGKLFAMALANTSPRSHRTGPPLIEPGRPVAMSIFSAKFPTSLRSGCLP